MRRLSDFSEGFFLIGLGLVMLFIIPKHELLNAKNTNKIEGTLKEFPEEGVHDESQDYVGLWITGYDNFYEFSSCSHNDDIHEEILKLKPGDKVILYAKKESSSTTYPWKGKKYKTYRICDAYSPELGQIIKFEQYNRCSENMTKYLLPALCGILMLMGVIRVIKKYFDKDNIIESKYLDLSDDKLLDSKDCYNLKPDKLAYVLRNSTLPIVSIVSGIILTNPFDPEYKNFIGHIFIFLGAAMWFYVFLKHDKVCYILDNRGIHIRTAPYFFRPEIEFIPYYSITEVDVKVAFYEEDRNIGTVKIHDGTYDDGNKIYTTLAGLKQYKDVADFIKTKANLK